MEGWGCGEWSELKAGMQGVDWGVKNTHGRRKRNGKVLKNPGGFGLDLLGSHILNHGGFFFYPSGFEHEDSFSWSTWGEIST